MTSPVVAAVPSDVAQVDYLYGPLIRATIRKSCDRKYPLPIDELDDLMQQIYLKMMERNFLPRCTAYLAEHPEKSFVLSLITFARNLTSNYLRDRGRRLARFPLANHDGAFESPGVYKRQLDSSVPSHENRILARQYLGEIAGFLMDEPEMLAIIEAALQADGELTASVVTLRRHGRVLSEKTVRRYIHRLRDRVREMVA